MKFEPKFYLDNPKLESTFIVMAVTCSDGRLKYSTGKKIDPKLWPEDDNYSYLPNNIRTRIVDLQDCVNQFRVHSQVNRGFPIPKDDVKASLLKLDNKAVKRKANSGSFSTDADKIIQLIRSGEILNPKNGKRYAENTVLNCEQVKKLLIEMTETPPFRNVPISFEDTDETTYSSFISFCNQKKYRVGSINTFIGHWKSLGMLTQHPKVKIKANDFFDSKKFKQVPAEPPFKVTLTDEEIGSLLDLELTGPLEAIRDRFVVNCYTGMRISDMKDLNESNFEGDTINVITKKKSKLVSIPVSERIRIIREKYHGGLPESYSGVHINKCIKDICKLAGIDEKVRYTEIVGGEEVKRERPKHELITNHTARRFASTEMQRNGINALDLDHILAMSLSTAKRYNKITPKGTAEKHKDNAFFK